MKLKTQLKGVVLFVVKIRRIGEPKYREFVNMKAREYNYKNNAILYIRKLFNENI